MVKRGGVGTLFARDFNYRGSYTLDPRPCTQVGDLARPCQALDVGLMRIGLHPTHLTHVLVLDYFRLSRLTPTPHVILLGSATFFLFNQKEH